MAAALDQFVTYLRAAFAPEPVTATATENLPRCVDHAAATVVEGAADLDRHLSRRGLQPAFTGWSPDGERLAILDGRHEYRQRQAPHSFRVAAIVPVFNEADVLEHTLEYLTRDGIGVYVLDNWSTDATPSIARSFHGRGLLGLERFPAAAPPDEYDLRGILSRVEQLATDLEVDWVVLHDADERRRSPWPDVSLRDALYQVDQAGFTCVDHVTLNFWPVDDGYNATHDVEAYFPHFEFSNHAGHFHQRRAWKRQHDGISLVRSAGHDVQFSGRRVYPYKFLLKHYPLRSRAQAERKLRDRNARWSAAERALGWHQQYDTLGAVVRDPGTLRHFDRRTFYEQHLIERLSGVGIFDEPPEWATAPFWAEPATAGNVQTYTRE